MGTSFSARMLHRSAGIELQPIQHSGEAAAGLAEDLGSGASALIAAVRARLPLRQSTLRFLNSAGEDLKRARALAEAAAKGMGEDPRALAELADAVAGGASLFGRSDTGSSSAGKDSGEDLEDSDRQDLGAYLLRRSARVDHPIQVFNHLKPRTGNLHWIVIPIGYWASSRRYEGTLRLGLDMSLARVERFSLEAGPEGERGLVRAHGEVSLRRMWIDLPDADAGQAGPFVRALPDWSILFEDQGDRDFDGFDKSPWRELVAGFGAGV